VNLVRSTTSSFTRAILLVPWAAAALGVALAVVGFATRSAAPAPSTAAPVHLELAFPEGV
ncbi:MAG: hypothetical protein ACRD2N_14595, partial [Vicinamibacterales bacterium]